MYDGVALLPEGAGMGWKQAITPIVIVANQKTIPLKNTLAGVPRAYPLKKNKQHERDPQHVRLMITIIASLM
jgi:hypothetical protein